MAAAATIQDLGWEPAVDLERKRLAYERLQVLEGAWAYLVKRRIAAIFEDPPTRTRVLQHVSTGLNVARALMEPISNAYNTPPRRYLSNSTKMLDRVYRGLVKESRVRTKAPDWNLRVNYVGLVAVAPVYRVDEATRETRLTLESYYPHQLDFQWGRHGMDAPPVAALITVYDTALDRWLGWQGFERGIAGYVHVDAQRWLYFDAGGRLSHETARAAGGDGVSPAIDHGLGELPLSIFTTGHGALDWWNTFRAQGLHDATLDAAVVYAIMRWVRKVQNRRVMTYGFTDAGQDKEVDDDGSVLDPETPVRLKPTEKIDVYSLDTPPDTFIKDIKFIIDTQADAHGIPASDVGLESGGGSDLAVTVRQSRLTTLRTKQVPHFQDSEYDLWDKAWRGGARSAHPEAAQMRRHPDAIEHLQIEFAELNLLDDPVRREEVYRKKLARAGVNPIEQIQNDNPHLTMAEAKERFEANLEVIAVANEKITRALGPMNEPDGTRITLKDGVQSGAQESGREGGQASPRDSEDSEA